MNPTTIKTTNINTSTDCIEENILFLSIHIKEITNKKNADKRISPKYTSYPPIT